MKIRAVAQVLEHVLGLGKRCLTNPGRTLAPHLGEGMRGAIWHPGGHVVATNAAHRMAALWHLGGGVMGATRTEVRNPLDGLIGHRKRLFFFLNPPDTLLQQVTGKESSYPTSDDQRDHRRRQLSHVGQ